LRSDAVTLWQSPAQLKKYDMLVLSCEGSQFGSIKRPSIGNIKDYADLGGRIFADHLHHYWLRSGKSPWPEITAKWVDSGKDLPSPFVAKIDSSFPKGDAFANWLVNVKASPTKGQIEIWGAQHSVETTLPPVSQQWIYFDHNPNDDSMRAGVAYMTLNTPAEIAATAPENQCGRVVFTDLHVLSASGATGAPDVSHVEAPFPTGCMGPQDLSSQEKALEFMLFDLSSCIQQEKEPPLPPIVP
jgi:hypothetical protein